MNQEENKLFTQPSKPVNNLQIDAAPEITDNSVIMDNSQAAIGQGFEHLADEEIQLRRSRRRMSMSPVMMQIMRQQIDDIRQHILQFQVLPTRNTSRYDYENVPNHLDILLFGPAGAGKTSLIKTFYRALHEKCTLPHQIESMLSVKDQYSNEGTTRFTRVSIKPDLADSAV